MQLFAKNLLENRGNVIMELSHEERIIVAVKLHAKHQSGLGLITPVAELNDGRIVPLEGENFCSTKQVFIPSKYEDIDNKFRVGELFKIRVELNTIISEKTSNPSKYKAIGNWAEKIPQSELAEVVVAELPDRNDRRLFCATLPATPYIFIRNASGDCFGPFEWGGENFEEGDSAEIVLKFVTGGGLGAAGGTKQIHQFNSELTGGRIVECEIDGRAKYLVSNIGALVNGAPFFDYASDKEVIEYVRILAGDGGNRIIDRQKLQVLAALASKNPRNSNQLAKQRLVRFSELADSGVEIQDLIQDSLDGYLKGGAGQEILESYVQRNKSRYLDQLKKDREVELDETLARKRDEIRSFEDRQEQMKKELTHLNDQIERTRIEAEKDVKANQETILAKASAQTAARLADGNKLCDEMETKISELKQSLGAYENLSQVDAKIGDQKNLWRIVQDQVTEERKQLTSLRQEIAKEEDELRKKLRDLKPYVEHINGSFVSGSTEAQDVSVKVNISSSQSEIPPLQRSVIEAIQQQLARRGRSLADWEVANLLICTQQSFMTFFAGLPGVGKTSLSRLLAEVQGAQKRLHEISVARGWTSLKDIVGFHNPLSDRFQPASTGLYQFLLAIEEESKDERFSAMSYVLLDEANLSPIEHYWSSFMAMSDSSRDRMLRIGQRNLSVPSHLRFLATINYDGTTEPLSPRVVDRAPVLVMAPGTLSEYQMSAVSAAVDLPLPAEQMELLFGGAIETPQFEVDEESAFVDVYEALKDASSDKGRPVNISQRKVVAMRQYCGKARPIMRLEGGALMALDLAILQHVLPQIRGHGQKFSKRLDDLKGTLDVHGLNRSSAFLDQIIAYGNADLHSYDFFCW